MPFEIKIKQKKCSLIILIIWIISIVFSWPWNILIKVQEQISISFENEQENIDYETTSNLVESIKLCAPLITYQHIITFYILSLCVVQYFLPLVILCATFALISYYLNVLNAKLIQYDANKSNSAPWRFQIF